MPGLMLVALVIIVSGFLAYSNSFHASFHWDDHEQIIGNAFIHDLSNFTDPGVWTDVNNRPLSKFSLAMSWHIGGEHVLVYHIVNLMLHLLTAFMVFLLTRYTISLLFKDDRHDRHLKDFAALFAALFFLLHPVQTMAVTYIVQRMTVMAALFYLLSVYLYARGRMAFLGDGNKGKSALLISLALLAGILGVLSKQNAVTFPAAFLLYEFFFIRKADGSLCRKFLTSFVIIMLTGFLVVLLAGWLPVETQRFTRLEYFSAQLGVLHKYILLILFPISQSADYFIVPGSELIGWNEVIGFTLLSGLLTTGILLFRNFKLISFGIFWFFLCMSVESGLIPIKDIMMEHRLYLPLAGVGMVMAGLIIRLVPYRKISYLYVISAIILIVLAIGTFNRNKVWKSDISLWEDCLEKNPRSSRAMNNLGVAIKTHALQITDPAVRTMELKKSISYFTNSGGGDTLFTEAYLNRGMAYIELNEYQKALADIKLIETNRPKQRYLRYYLEGVILARQGDMQPAKSLFDEAISMNPDFALLYTWRGLVQTELAAYQPALEDFMRSVELDPTQTILYVNISHLYYNLSQFSEALEWIRKARQAGEVVDINYMNKLEETVSGN